MFVATRPLSESLPFGDTVLHQAGDELTRFLAWDGAVQLALRRMGYVEERPGALSPPAAGPCQPEKAVVAAPACPKCPGRKFANTQGLRLHTTRMHGGKA